jgi:hypothetical protein
MDLLQLSCRDAFDLEWKMASNKHYEIDLVELEVVETETPPLEELLRLADLPNLPNPFGIRLKRGKFVSDRGKQWLLDERLSEFNYQRSGYSNEISQFRMRISFDTALGVQELDEARFIYSVARNLSKSSWRNRRHGVGAFFQLGQVEEGSIRFDLYAGILAVGSFVASYPALKQGFREILSDAPFVIEQIGTALRAAKISEPIDRERTRDIPDMLFTTEKPRRNAPERPKLLRKD